MAKCLECGESYYGPENICAPCQVDMNKRSKFRELMNELEKITQLPEGYKSNEGNKFMHGFSYAEQENFSLTFRKLQKKFHFPMEFEDFSNSRAIEEAKKLYITEYPHILEKYLNPNDKVSLYNIKHKLIERSPTGNAWDDANLSDLLCFCTLQGGHAVDLIIPSLDSKEEKPEGAT